MNRPLGGLRPIYYALLIFLLLLLAVGEIRRQKNSRDLSLDREHLIEARQTLLGLERELLQSRVDEAEALATGRGTLAERLKERQSIIQLRLESAVHELSPLLADPATVENLVAAVQKYRRSVIAELELSSRIGGQSRSDGFVGELRRLESLLLERAGSARDVDGALRRELLELKIQQRDYVATLKTSQATDLLRRVDALRERLKGEKARGSRLADSLDDYRRQVESVMSASLEMELLRSESGLRFDRLPPIFRAIESDLDERLESTSTDIAALRRETAWRVAVFLGFALLLLAFRMRAERREADRTLLGIRQLVSGMAAFADGVEQSGLELPRSGELGQVADSFLSMAGQIRAQISTIDQERQRAEEAALAKADFLARVSHELRTPLHGVLGMAEVLEASKLNADQSYLLKVIRDSGNTLLAMVNDLLDFERLEAGKLVLEPSLFDAFDLLEDLVATQAPLAHGKGLELVLHLPAQTLPSVEGDPVRTNQILTNLVGNALKFTESGFVEVRLIGIEPTEPGRGRLELVVRDSGPGISESLRDRIFEPFTQGERFLRRTHGGSGLGLSIVSDLVKLMNGRVVLEDPSETEPGATFRVSIEVGLPAPPAPVEPVLEGLSILLVERRPRMQECLTSLLEGWGAQVVTGDRLLNEFADSQGGPDEGRSPEVVVIGYPPQERAKDPTHLGLDLARRSLPSVHILPTDAWGLSMQSDLLAEHRVTPQLIGIRRPARRELLLNGIETVLGRAEPQAYEEALVSDSEDPLLAASRVLLVEDNPINQEVFEMILEDCGCEIQVAENGQQAVEMAQVEEFDLIFMDCQMPVMNGYDATRAIRALKDIRRSTVPIVALTAGALEEERLRCIEAGMDDVVSKPADRQTILRRLRQYTRAGTSLAGDPPSWSK